MFGQPLNWYPLSSGQKSGTVAILTSNKPSKQAKPHTITEKPMNMTHYANVNI